MSLTEVRRRVVREMRESLQDVLKNAKKCRYKGYTCIVYGPNTAFVVCKYYKGHYILWGNLDDCKRYIDHRLHLREVVGFTDEEEKRSERSYSDHFNRIGVIYELDRRNHFNKL